MDNTTVFVRKWTPEQIYRSLDAMQVLLWMRRAEVQMGIARHGEYLDKAWDDLEAALLPDEHLEEVRRG